MPKLDGILERLQALEKSYGPPRKRVDMDAYRMFFVAGEYTRVVSLVKEQLKLDMGLRVGYVNHVKNDRRKNSPAWINVPDVMPHYGTSAFRNQKLDMFVRKEYLRMCTYENFVTIVAHELSHVVLDSTWHTFRKCEKTVDLASMYLGYYDVVLSGKRVDHYETLYEEKEVVRRKWIFFGKKYTKKVRIPKPFTYHGTHGYLTEDELAYAHRYIRDRVR